MKKIKAYIECKKNGPEMWACSMVFENGAAMFGHLCSAPGYAYGDLWGRRKKRQDILSMMGYQVVEIEVLEKLPKEILERNRDHKSYKGFMDEYDKKKKELKNDKTN